MDVFTALTCLVNSALWSLVQPIYGILWKQPLWHASDGHMKLVWYVISFTMQGKPAITTHDLQPRALVCNQTSRLGHYQLFLLHTSVILLPTVDWPGLTSSLLENSTLSFSFRFPCKTIQLAFSTDENIMSELMLFLKHLYSRLGFPDNLHTGVHLQYLMEPSKPSVFKCYDLGSWRFTALQHNQEQAWQNTFIHKLPLGL